ncbi:MAG: hypothetical protein M5U17_00670 [Ignavibacterium sp.]|nr:hypothetical protein [Ignavibacterium sp.]
MILLSFTQLITAQEFDEVKDDSTGMEIYLIDAYVKPEPPYTFILSFFTSEFCTSKVVIDNHYEFVVSDSLSETHSSQIDISALKFTERNVRFVIETVDSNGKKSESEEFEFDLPYEPAIAEGSSIWTLCLFAGSVFLLPMPGYVIADNHSSFSITKDLPIISFRAKRGNYPSGYISLEYTYVFDIRYNNYLRFGYKKIFPIDYVEYISPGLTAYTNFMGQNGIAPEISIGWFTLLDTFTFYTRYRYNIKPKDSSSNFHEINLGLYTRFLSIYL